MENDDERPHARRALHDLAADQYGHFAVHQWTAAGLSLHQLRTGVDRGYYERVWPGVMRVTGAPRTWVGDVMAATLVDPGRIVAARRTALRLHGLGAWHDPRPHIVIPHDTRYGFTPDRIVTHSSRTLLRDEPTTARGIGTSSVDRALIEDGIEFPGERWYDMVCEAVRLGLVTPQSLLATLGSMGRIRNRRQMREDFEGLDPRLTEARSVPEVSLLHVFEEVTGCEVLLNHVVHGLGGTRLGEVDVVIPKLLLGGEGDSRLWHIQPSAMDRDLVRDLDFRANHWIIPRFPLGMLRTQPHKIRRGVEIAYERAVARLPLVPQEYRDAAMQNTQRAVAPTGP